MLKETEIKSIHCFLWYGKLKHPAPEVSYYNLSNLTKETVGRLKNQFALFVSNVKSND